MEAYVYTLPGCGACKRARSLLREQGYEPREVPIDNPVLELGIKLLFRDGGVHAPVIVLPGRGAYVLGEDDRLLRIVSLEPEAVA